MMIGTIRNIELFEVVLAIVVWLIPIALEVFYRPSNLRYLRISLWTLAIGSMLCYYLQPYREVDTPKQHFIMAGENIAMDQDSLKAANIEVLSPTDYLRTLHSANVGNLHLYQYNLQPWELASIEFDSLIHTPTLALGITDIRLPESIYTNQSCTITLIVKTIDRLAIQLLLGTELIDKEQLEEGESRVKFNIEPTISGNFLYQIIGINNGDTVIHEKLALQVEEAQKPSILMITSNPSFEVRFLKNHLTDLGFELNVRNRISQNSYSKEFINTPKIAVAKITKDLLADTDMLVLDAGAFLKLSTQEKALIKKKNAENSLGILFLDIDQKAIKYLTGVVVSRTKEANVDLRGFGEISIQTTWSSQLEKIKLSNATLGYKLSNGLGNVGLVAATNLYQIKLSGNEALYGEVWKVLTKDFIPAVSNQVFFEIPNLIRINERTEILFDSPSHVPSMTCQGTQIPLIESITRAKIYDGTFWPTKEGCNQLTIMPDATIKYFYVYGKDDWAGVRITRENAYQQMYQKNNSKVKRPDITQKIFLSNWIYFWIFMTCMGLLWAEQRFINPS